MKYPTSHILKFFTNTLLFIAILLSPAAATYDNTRLDFTSRQEAYRSFAIEHPTNKDALVIQAYVGNPLTQEYLDKILLDILTDKDADFYLIHLVRILLFTSEYDELILPVIEKLPMFLQEGEDTRVYWSENHMIMWDSSAWLLHEREGWEIDTRQERRLRHFLDLKIDYGFYEFNSATYLPYTFKALLNLSDFAEDREIQEKATLAVKRLLSEMLIFTNERGVYFPAAGRSYLSKYIEAYGANHSSLIYLLTGMGEIPDSLSSAISFLATSNLDVDDVIKAWTPELYMTYRIGHPFRESDSIHSGLVKADRIMMQWSSGGYFHPSVADETFWLIEEYNLWDHSHTNDYAGFAGLPNWVAFPIAKVLASITRSSVLTGAVLVVFKNGPVVLSSVQNYYKGRLGYQQWPWAATVGTLAVWTQSGEVKRNWNDRSDQNVNTHLPYINQKENVALIMYKPNNDLDLYGFQNDVALYWPEEEFDETRSFNIWLLGQQGDGYIAVRKHCSRTINGYQACSDSNGQTWAVVVGNSNIYGSFDKFEDVIKRAKFTKKKRWSWSKLRFQYYAKISVDGKTVSLKW